MNHGRGEGSFWMSNAGTNRSLTIGTASTQELIASIVYEGAHFLGAAGNNNNYIDSRDYAELGANGSNTGNGAQSLNKISWFLSNFWTNGGNDRTSSGHYGLQYLHRELSENYYSGANIRSNMTSKTYTFSGAPGGSFGSLNLANATDYPPFYIGRQSEAAKPISMTTPTITVSALPGGAYAGQTDKHFTQLRYSTTSTELPFRFKFYEDHIEELEALGYSMNMSAFDGFRDKLNDMATITVGDITPLNDPFGSRLINTQQATDYTGFGPGSNGGLAFTYLLSGINQNSDTETTKYFPLCSFSQYQDVSGAPYVKTAYSTTGPSVDVWAPGNGTIAAVSNNKSILGLYPLQWGSDAFAAGLESKHNGFRYFNGTSAACPVAAGCLATYLAVHPTATPKQAKNWLISSSIKGAILETSGTEYYDALGATNTGALSGRTLLDNVIDDNGGKKHAWHIVSPYRREDNVNAIMGTTIGSAVCSGAKDGLYHAYYPNLTNGFRGQVNADQYQVWGTVGTADGIGYKRKLLAVQQSLGFFRCHNRVVQAYPQRQLIVNYPGGGANDRIDATAIEGVAGPTVTYLLSGNEPTSRNVFPGAGNDGTVPGYESFDTTE